MRIDGDGVGKFEPAIAHGPLVGQQHAATISCVHVQPHVLAIGDAAQFADVVDRAGVGGSEHAHDAHRAYAIFLVLGNRILEGVEADLEIGVGGQRTERVSAQTDAVDGFVDGDVPFFRGVDGPAFADAVVLRLVMRDRITADLQADEVGHHAATGEVSARLRIVATQIGEPAHDAPLEGNGGGADRVSADVLVER